MYKKGDKVAILGNISGHGFKKGEVVKIGSVTKHPNGHTYLHADMEHHLPYEFTHAECKLLPPATNLEASSILESEY